MAKKKMDKRTKKARSLPARDSSKVKGGLTSAFSNAIKSIGEGLSTMARKG